MWCWMSSVCQQYGIQGIQCLDSRVVAGLLGPLGLHVPKPTGSGLGWVLGVSVKVGPWVSCVSWCPVNSSD